jgi:hypothetical protein
MKEELSKLRSNSLDFVREKKKHQNPTPVKERRRNHRLPSIHEEIVVYPRSEDRVLTPKDARRQQLLIAYQELRSQKLRNHLERL